MEYLAGSLITLFLIFAARYFYEVSKPKDIKIRLGFSQSRMFHITRPALQMMIQQKPFSTQATRHFDSQKVKVIFTNDKAYWIRNNAVYQANVINGIVQENSTEIVDMMALDEVKLKDMMFIIDKLTEGQRNDSGNPWDSKF
jgi:hypothetical protein